MNLKQCCSMINSIFSDYLIIHFDNFVVVYTGSVSPLSPRYSFYISELHISFKNIILPSFFFFTAECDAIIEVLTLI